MKPKNILRSKEYMALSREMASCTNLLQLNGVKERVLAYHKAKNKDYGELLANFLCAEDKLNPEYRDLEGDSIEGTGHARYEGAEIESIIHQRMYGFR